MLFINSILLFFVQEVRLEFRYFYSIGSILIYIFSIIFICYINININDIFLNPMIWNSLFWIILLFISLYSVSKSFLRENESRLLYYYSLISSEIMIFSKVFYNIFLLFFFFLLTYILFIFFLGNPVKNQFLFLINLLFASLSFSLIFTLMSAISSKSENGNMLMSIISIPLSIPILLLLIKISRNSLYYYDFMISLWYIIVLFFIDMVLFFLLYILFPYLWKS